MKITLRKYDLLALASACVLALLVSAGAIASIQGDAEKLSSSRLVLIGAVIALAIATAICSGAYLKKYGFTTRTFDLPRCRYASFLAVMFVGIMIGWTSLMLDARMLHGSLFFYFERIRPLLIATGFIGLSILLLTALRLQQTADNSNILRTGKIAKSILVIFAGLLIIFGGMYITRFGLITEQPNLWNVPGIPISSMQGMAVFSLMILVMLILASSPRIENWTKTNRAAIIVSGLLVLTAIGVWITTPMVAHYFSLAPAPPAFQPYPYSDARIHDLGAISILQGDGIFFRNYTDKPLYMILLAGFHLIAGDDYTLIQNLQASLIAFGAIFLFLIGRRTHSLLFGILAAILFIVQQRNAMVLSQMISSANVKILTTEAITLAGLMMLTYLLMRWSERRTYALAIAMGGSIGALSLIRMNPLFFIPFLLISLLIIYRKHRAQMIRQGLALVLGFSIVFLPWVFSGVNALGIPWLAVKVMDMYQQRLLPQLQGSGQYQETGVHVSAGKAGYALVTTAATSNEVNASRGYAKGGYAGLAAEHFMHNLATSLMILPDTPYLQELKILADRECWKDDQRWDGRLPGGQLVMIAINLALIAVGFTSAWRRRRWQGLLPIFVFLVYNVSLSVSLTSGGRYIVPISWIVFWYYALGVVAILGYALKRVFGLGSFPVIAVPAKGIEVANTNKRTTFTTLAILILIGALVPITNQVIPAMSPQPVEVDVEAMMQEKGIPAESGRDYIHGKVLYPYLSETSFRFMYLGVSGSWMEVTLPRDGVTEKLVVLGHGENVIVGLRAEGQPTINPLD